MALTSWKRRSFLSLNNNDKEDSIVAGSHFNVGYAGSAYVDKNFEGRYRKAKLLRFYENLVKNFPFVSSSQLQLIVDLRGAVFHDKAGAVVQRFELCDIRDVIYCTTNQDYLKYFVLIGKEESCLSIKAHVLICESKQKAKSLFQTFTEAFTLFTEVKRLKRKMEEPRSEFLPVDDENNSESNSVGYRTTHSIERSFPLVKKESNPTGNWPTLVCSRGDRGLDSQGNSDAYLEDCFTELARSRSRSADVSSTTSYASDNGSQFQDFSSAEDVFC